MIILGIDPGTLITGYGIIDHQSSCCIAIDYGCIRPPASMMLSDRYLIIFNAIEDLIEQYRPHVLAIETQYVDRKHNNVQSAIKLGMARGIAVIAAKRKGIPVFEYSPSKAKIAVVGKGSASKFQVQAMIKLLLNIANDLPEDAADALALAICHGHSLQVPASVNCEL